MRTNIFIRRSQIWDADRKTKVMVSRKKYYGNEKATTDKFELLVEYSKKLVTSRKNFMQTKIFK